MNREKSMINKIPTVEDDKGLIITQPLEMTPAAPAA